MKSFDDLNGPQFLAAEFIADVEKYDPSTISDDLLIQRYIMTIFCYSTDDDLTYRAPLEGDLRVT